MIDSEDNQQKNSGNEDSCHKNDPENENQGSKTEASDNPVTKCSSGDPRTKSFNTRSVDDRENKSARNDRVQTENLSLSDSKLFKTDSISIKNPQVEINKDQNSTSPESTRSDSLENFYNTSAETSENSEQSQSKEISDNDFLSANGFRQSPGYGTATQPNLVNDETDTSPSIRSVSSENHNSASTEISENSELSQPKEISDNDSFSADGSPQSPVSGSSRDQNLLNDDTDTSPLTEEICGSSTNLTDFGDVSEVTSDTMDTTLRVQKKKKKKQKATNESESESLEDYPVRNFNFFIPPNFFIPIRNESSTKEAESTTTDDVRLTPFEDIGSEKNQPKPLQSSSENSASSEDQDSANTEMSDHGSTSNKSENRNTSDEQISMNKPNNSKAPENQVSLNIWNHPDKSEPSNSTENLGNESTTNELFRYCEKPVDESTKNKSTNPETPDDESIIDISDNLKTSELKGDKPYNPESEVEISLIDLENESTNSQKRKLSTIYEEVEEFENNTKRLRTFENYNKHVSP